MTAPHPTVGRPLAESVTDALDRGRCLAFMHRDYCGMGLAKDAQCYVYDAVYDGFPPTVAMASSTAPDRRVFRTREAFVDWLSDQTDASLSGADLPEHFFRQNQRLTLARLQQFCA